MDMVDYDVNDFNERYAGDKSVYAKFYTMPVRDDAASAQAGRPIYKDREYIEIRAAGNQNNIIQRPASQMDRQRFNRQYEHFKAGADEQLIGTPLSELTWLTKSQIEELAYVRVRTLEALANISDDTCQRMSGLHDLKLKAARYLEESEKAAPFTALEAENKALKGQVDALTSQMKEMTEALRQLQPNAKAAK